MLQFRRLAMAGGAKINTENYLNIEALEDGMTVNWKRNDCEYCVDADGMWKTLPKGTTSPSVSAGQTISLRARATTAGYGTSIGTINISKKCNLSGNVMSLSAYKNAADVTSVTADYYMQSLFAGAPIVSARHLKLPAVKLGFCVYNSMFYNCVFLEDAPELPATTLGSSCYLAMFEGCKSLVESPLLPATTVEQSCYKKMFKDCVSLTKAPELPAVNLTGMGECYAYMFEGCTSLVNAPALNATDIASYCYQGMFRYCTSLAVAPNLPAVKTEWGCYQSMFNGCTSLKSTPTILATQLAKACFEYMFYNCASLERVEELPANTSIALPTGTKMFAGCSKLNYVKAFLSIASTEMMPDWMSGVAEHGTFITSRKSQWPTGSSGIPEGWTVEYVD